MRILQSRHCLDENFLIQRMAVATYISQFQRKIQRLLLRVYDVIPDADCNLLDNLMPHAEQRVLPEIVLSSMLSFSFLIMHAYKKCCYREGDELLVMILIKTCYRRGDPGETRIQ